MSESNPLLLEGEEAPAIIVNGSGGGDFVLVCEHAGRLIPQQLGTLGLSEAELERHIAYDIGAEPVARQLADLIDSPLVLQRYSRLVYDCNRPPDAPSAMPDLSETTVIPGNVRLTAGARQSRTEEIYEPFHGAVSQLLNRAEQDGRQPILVTIHSFTPVYKGVSRHLDLGILHDEDARFADRILSLLAGEPDIASRRNEPYGPRDGVTHTLKLHAEARRLLNVMIEIRNDHIADEAGQSAWAEKLASLLREAADGDTYGQGRGNHGHT